jgi:hypothetical protein
MTFVETQLQKVISIEERILDTNVGKQLSEAATYV